MTTTIDSLIEKYKIIEHFDGRFTINDVLREFLQDLSNLKKDSPTVAMVLAYEQGIEEGIRRSKEEVEIKRINCFEFIACPNCDNDVSATNRYCPTCGKKIKWIS